MSLLTMVTQVCYRIGITPPASVSSSSDPQIQQIMGLANDEGQELSSRYPWQAIIVEKTFLTLAAETQGTIASLAGTDFRYILNDIMWNRSLLRPVLGPLMPYQWQELKARNITGPWAQYRIRQGSLLFIPIPAVGNTIAFEYMSKNWVTLNAGGTGSTWANDSDTGLLSEEIMGVGMRWRWKAAKGLPYQEDYQQYEGLVADEMARDGGKPLLNLEGNVRDYPYGVVVPIGSWNL